MLQQPKKTKFRKNQKGRLKKISRNGQLRFGMLGLKALRPVRITRAQLESGRRAIARRTKKLGKVWVNVFPDLIVTAKPSETRIGKGKGRLDYWACRISPGTIIYEIERTQYRGSSPKLRLNEAQAALKAAAIKLPCRTTIVTL